MAVSKKPSSKPRRQRTQAAKTADRPAVKQSLKENAKPAGKQSPRPAPAALSAPTVKEAAGEAAAAITQQVPAPEPKAPVKDSSSPVAPASSPEALAAATAAPKAETAPAQTESRTTEAKLEVKPSPAPTAHPNGVLEEATAGLSKEVQMHAELPREAANIARKSVDQAQAAFDKANDLAHSNVQIFDAAAGAFKSNATELQLKAMEIAQANSNAVFGLLRNLLAARQVTELFDVQRSFASEQLVSFVRHMNELNAISLKFASDTARPLQQGVLRSFEELKKAAAS